MKSKISITLATILTISAIMDDGFRSLSDTAITWIVFFLFFKISWLAIRWLVSPNGRRHIFSSLDTTYVDKKIINNLFGGRSYTNHRYQNTYSQQRNADQRVWERTKAQNNAAYQEYQARQANYYNANSYDAYQKQNRAQEARNNANKPY